MLFFPGFTAIAQEPIKVILDGKALEFDVQPTLMDGRTMVPMRVIFEELGANIQWDGASRTITATKEGLVVKATIDDKNININGIETAMDVAPVIVDGRTLVPVRFISEAFGCVVDWDGNTSTVYIYSVMEEADWPEYSYSDNDTLPDDEDLSDYFNSLPDPDAEYDANERF